MGQRLSQDLHDVLPELKGKHPLRTRAAKWLEETKFSAALPSERRPLVTIPAHFSVALALRMLNTGSVEPEQDRRNQLKSGAGAPVLSAPVVSQEVARVVCALWFPLP